MKWINHDIIGFAVPFALMGNLPFAVVSCVAAVIPDAIEGKPDAKVLQHRGFSHHPAVWLLACGGMSAIAYSLRWDLTALGLAHQLPISPKMALQIVTAFSVGIFSHLVTDAMTMTGVPISFDCRKRFAMKLFATGALVESVICWLILALSVLLQRETLISLFF